MKVVVVTGGSSGIGRATCHRFAQDGYTVVVADVRDTPREDGTPTHEQITGNDETAQFIETDVTDWAAVQDLVDDTWNAFGRIDVFINNAGVAERGRIDELPVEDAHNIFRVNIDGVYHGMKAVIPRMTEQGDGSIVNVSSGAGKTGFPQLAAYCGSKFAVIGMTEAVAHEIDDAGITCNAVCPGRTRTAMTGFEGVPPENVADVVHETSQAAYTGRAVDV